MEEKNLKTWLELEKEITELETLRSKLSIQANQEVSPLLFRGQANASWELKSTLERYTNKVETTAWEYFRIANKVRPQIETYTGKSWNVDWDCIDKWCRGPNLLLLSTFPVPEYLIYLRHHGFPSPLLDWTKSPFIASFFAFSEVPQTAQEVAIYAYIECTGRGKSQDGDDPVISTLSSNIVSHRRHFLQQSEYTVCAAEANNGVVFSSYEKAFSKTQSGENLLWKFTFPVSERMEVLKKLDLMNINSLSLFDNEESLMSTVALRVFYLDDIQPFRIS